MPERQCLGVEATADHPLGIVLKTGDNTPVLIDQKITGEEYVLYCKFLKPGYFCSKALEDPTVAPNPLRSLQSHPDCRLPKA